MREAWYKYALFFTILRKKDIDCTHFKDEAYKVKALVLKGAKLLSETEIVFLTKFIYEEIKNKPITKRYCFAFFNKKEEINVIGTLNNLSKLYYYF